MDPFSQAVPAELPCIPDLYDEPSQKFFTFRRGSLAVGTGGVGGIYAGYGAGSDQNYLAYTGSSYGGTSLLLPPIATAGVALTANTNFPYVGNSVACRLVGMGLRIRYTGTELNRGGTLYPVMRQNANDNIVNNANVVARRSAVALPVTIKWHTITWKPSWRTILEYSNSGFPILDASTSAFLGFVIQSANGNTFDYELIQYWEAVDNGNILVNNPTPSHSDVQGNSLIRDYLGSISTTLGGPQVLEDFYKFARARFQESAALVLSTAASYAASRSGLLEY